MSFKMILLYANIKDPVHSGSFFNALIGFIHSNNNYYLIHEKEEYNMTLADATIGWRSNTGPILSVLIMKPMRPSLM